MTSWVRAGLLHDQVRLSDICIICHHISTDGCALDLSLLTAPHLHLLLGGCEQS